MTEIRRVKLKFGDAEFEADVPEDRVQPMYDRFLSTLERRNRTPPRPPNGDGKAPITSPIHPRLDRAPSLACARDDTAAPFLASPEFFDHGLLRRVFDLREDGVVILKLLPKGAEKGAESLLLILYGYRRLKNEDGVLATQLHRAAEHSGVSIRWPAYELAPYDRFVNRVGRRKGSAYSLNDEGLAKAQAITTRILGAVLIQGQPPVLG
jgi:hypothetical protein